MESFQTWLENTAVFTYPILAKWQSLPLPALKNHLGNVINALESDAQTPDMIQLRLDMQELLPQLKASPYARALDTEIAMLDALANN